MIKRFYRWLFKSEFPICKELCDELHLMNRLYKDLHDEMNAIKKDRDHLQEVISNLNMEFRSCIEENLALRAKQDNKCQSNEISNHKKQIESLEQEIIVWKEKACFQNWPKSEQNV